MLCSSRVAERLKEVVQSRRSAFPCIGRRAQAVGDGHALMRLLICRECIQIGGIGDSYTRLLLDCPLN